MSHDLSAVEPAVIGGDATLPAAAVTRASAALAGGCEMDPARQGYAVQGLHGFKRELAQSVRDTYAAMGQGGPTPGELAYHNLCAKAGIAPGDPSFGQVAAVLTGMVPAA